MELSNNFEIVGMIIILFFLCLAWKSEHDLASVGMLHLTLGASLAVDGDESTTEVKCGHSLLLLQVCLPRRQGTLPTVSLKQMTARTVF